MTALAQNRWIVLLGAIGVGVACGGVVARHPTWAALLAIGVAAFIGLTVLGDRAFAWAITLVAVAPWYPFINDVAAGPRVPQRVLCAAIAAAPLVPWLWSAASERRAVRRRPSRRALLYGIVFVCLTISIHESVGALKPMIESGTFGLLFAGVTFLCARRFADTRETWGPAAFAGLAVLISMGLLAYAQDRGNRVGYFTGYPITFGALVVGLAPSALVYAARRYSPALALGMGAAAAFVLIVSESRSSWVASVGVLLVLVAFLIRQQRWRALRAVTALAVIAGIAIMSTGSLHGIIERKLSANVAQTDSVTHRAWSYGYAVDQIRERPIFGGGAPGYSASQAANLTAIGAIDNGYLSITVDTGFFGLAAVLVPILVALSLLARWLWFAYDPPAEDLALVLGIVGMALVTIFYDSFYWAQIIMLLTAMGGTLSVRRYPFHARRRRRAPQRRRPPVNRSRRDFPLAGPSL
jgi:O-antigen ligase